LLEHIYPTDWHFTRHLELVNRKILETVRTGGRLILEIPVRHGKSEIATFGTPLWLLENWPGKRVCLVSMEERFATRFGRRIRNAIQQHHRILTVRLAPDISSASEWETTAEGGMLSIGIGGSMIGRGFDLLLIDDPIGSWEDAKSELVRDRMWEWWEGTARSRIEPGGAVILIMARWHPDDLAGRMVNPEFNGELAYDWEVINLPALAEESDPLGRKPGEALWPERWPEEVLEQISKGDNRVWNAQYQQHPYATEGNFFDASWLQDVPALPKSKNVVRAWDLASSKAKRGRKKKDMSVGGLVAEVDGQYFVKIDQRGNWTPKQVKDRVRNTAEHDGRTIPIYMWQDPGQAGKDQADTYRRIVLKGYAVNFQAVGQTDKITYAEPVSTAAEGGNLFFAKTPHRKAAKEVFKRFPDGDTDDDVDMVSLGFIGVASKSSGRRKAAPMSAGRRVNQWKVRA
jgi:predicted phage terminase large subunit-like protein